MNRHFRYARPVRFPGTVLFGLILLPALATAQPRAGDVHLSVVLASDYKQNGLSQTESDPALRFLVDWEHESGVFSGGAVGNVAFLSDRNQEIERESVASAYVGYSWRLNRWSGSISAARYVYPDYGRYNHTQATAAASWRGRYHLSYSYSDDYYSIGQPAELYRGGISQPWLWDLEAGINAGRFVSDERFDIGYDFFDIGLSRIFGRFALDLRYHDDNYDRATPIGETGEDRWVFSISVALSPRPQ